MSGWKSLSLPSQVLFFDVWGEEGSPLYVAGEKGSLFVSEDGGGSFHPIETGSQATFRQLAGPSQKDLFLVGSSSHGSVLLHSEDGRRFRKCKIGRRQELRSVAVWGDEVYLLGSREILKSEDHGQTFETVFSGYLSMNSLLCLGPGHVLAAGYDTIRLSTDGGETWEKMNHHITAHLGDLDGSLSHGVYAVGYWDVAFSGDGGRTWEPRMEAARGGTWRSVLVRGPDDIYLVGEPGLILHSSDGKTFQREKSDAPRSLCRVRAVGDDVFIVGEGLLSKRCTPRRATGAAAPALAGAPAKRAKAKKTASPPKKTTAGKSAALIHEQVQKRGVDGRGAFLETKGITSLDALKEYPQLEYLSLWGVLPDLATLPALPRVKSLSLYGKARDLSPLSSQPALESLSLKGANPPLSGLPSLPRLAHLDLGECPRVSDLSPLAACPMLESLTLPKDPGDLRALNASASLKNLTLRAQAERLKDVTLPLSSLYIQQEDLQDLSFLAHLTSLQSLDLLACLARDLSPLGGMTRLERLSIFSPHLSDLSPLSQLLHLKHLRLGLGLCDLSPLADLARLEFLFLDDNKALQSLRGLEGLGALSVLSLNKTGVSDLGPLSRLSGLESLSLEKTKVERLSSLSSLKALMSLRLGGARLCDLTGVEGLLALQTLDIHDTRVKDLSPLRGLPSLENLNIGRLGKVDHADAVRTLSSLVDLNVERTDFDPSWLVGLPKLRRVRGCTFPAPGACLEGPPLHPMGSELGPGRIFDGRIGMIEVKTPVLEDIALSPNGAYLAVALHGVQGEGVVHVYETTRARRVAVLGEGASKGQGVAFSADGKQLFCSWRRTQYDNDLGLFRAPLDDLSHPEQLAALPRRTGGRLTTDATGDLVALVTDRVDLYRLSGAAWEKTLMGDLDHSPLRAVFAHRAPRLYVWGLEKGRISGYDVDRGVVAQSWQAPYEDGQFMTLSGDERVLVAVVQNGYGVSVLDLARGERLLTEHFTIGTHQPAALVSTDGSLLVRVGGELSGFRLPEGAGPAPGPLTGMEVGWFSVAAANAREGKMVAFAAVNYGRGGWPRVLWVPLV